LRRYRPDIDLVCVSRLSQEAHVAISALAGSGVPVVLRAEADGAAESPRSSGAAGISHRVTRSCGAAHAVVAACGGVERAVIEAGFHAARVRLIPNGVAPAPDRSATLQAAARAALSEANCDLHVPGDAPVALAVGPLEARSDFHVLIKAWTRVARLWPLARLWLIGDGTRRERLFKQVHEAGLSGRVLMPGTFDDARGLLQAADLLVLPAATAGEPLVLLEAMAVGVPVVASDSPGHRQLVEDGVTGRLVAPGSSSRFAQAILEIFQDHHRAALMAVAATQRVRQERSLSMMVERHVALFRELMASTARSNP